MKQSTAQATPDTAAQQHQLVQVVLVGGALAFAALVVCLNTGGGAPVASPPGIPDPGSLTGWGLPIVKVVADLAAVVTVGCLLVSAFLLPAVGPDLKGRRVIVVRAVRWTALTWFAAVALSTVLTLSDLLATPVGELSFTEVRSFVFQVSAGRALVAEAVLIVVVAIASRWIVTVSEATVLLVLSLVAFVPPALTGHSASSGSHDVAVVSILVHVVAVSLWVGGLVGLLWITALGAPDAGYAVRRFSTLAAWCLTIVLVSGVINASVRIDSVAEVFTTGYGNLVLVKAGCLVCLGVFGWAHRRRSISALTADPDTSLGWTRFVKIASAEVCLMAVTVGVAVALSRTPTPINAVYTSPVEDLLGAELPPAPNVQRLLVGHTPSGVGLFVVMFGAAFYLAGLVIMRRNHNRWPVGRILSWFLGLVVVGWATFGGLGLYSHVLFSAHMVSHMFLSMVAPFLLVLGAPVTLALRTLPGPRVPGERSPRGMLVSFLRSPFVRFVTHPIVVTALFLLSLYALYFTSLFDRLMSNHLGHAAMQLHFLLVGCLFFYVLVGVDPSPHRLHPVARLGLLLLIIPAHAFFSIAIMSSDEVIARGYFTQLHRPYNTDLLHDQYLGGSMSWALGEIPTIAVLLAIFVQWIRSDAREARRTDRREDAKAPGESELDEYNRRLALIHASDIATNTAKPDSKTTGRGDT